MMRGPKRILLWMICYVISFLCFIIDFPVLLFAFYPYSIAALAIYIIVVAMLSVLRFRKSADQYTEIKLTLVIFLLIPMVVLIATFISIEMGWLRFPG